MTAHAASLAGFLLARIAEDDLFWETVGDWGQAHPDRVKRYRAGCEAKRRIVEELRDAMEYDDSISEAETTTAAAGARVLNHLAAVYADHPDYREEWKA